MQLFLEEVNEGWIDRSAVFLILASLMAMPSFVRMTTPDSNKGSSFT
jgi:hypothetical protein